MLIVFSPAYNFSKFRDKMRGLSQEFYHDLARLFVRPNSPSANHWLDRSFSRLLQFYAAKLSKGKQAYPLFDNALEKGSTDKKPIWDEYNLRFMLNGAKLESDYGVSENKMTEQNVELFILLIKELFNDVKNTAAVQKPDTELPKKLIMKYYEKIPNHSEKLIDKYKLD